MKPQYTIIISTAAYVSVLIFGSWAYASANSAYDEQPPITKPPCENNNLLALLLAQAGDEIKNLESDSIPASRPRGDSDWQYNRDRKARGRFGRDREQQGLDQDFDQARGTGRGKDRGGRSEFMTQTEIEQLMTFAKEHFPKLHERLKSAQETDPRSFRHMLRRIGGPLFHLYRIYRHDPELAELMIAEHKTQMEIFTMQREYREAISETEKAGIQTALRAELAKRFEYRQQQLKLKIERLRKRLDEQAKRLEESEKNKETLIDDELQKSIDQLKGKGRL